MKKGMLIKKLKESGNILKNNSKYDLKILIKNDIYLDIYKNHKGDYTSRLGNFSLKQINKSLIYFKKMKTGTLKKLDSQYNISPDLYMCLTGDLPHEAKNIVN